MSPTHQTHRLQRNCTVIFCLLCASTLAPCSLQASASPPQSPAIVAQNLQPYTGNWQWMFKGKPFATMHLVPSGDHFTGYMTNGFFTNDDDGNMTDAGSQPGQSPITRTFFSGKVLHIVVQDDHDKSLSEWTMTLLENKRAEFNIADPDAPKNIKPWLAQRAD
jgi:hypothetical protein